MLHLLYSRLARARRRYYQRRPYLRRRLAAPVISVGNLTVGGSGKTPLAAEIARILIEMGERPSVLSRGYARQIADAGVVVVSDGRSILADVAHSGDEPQWLARKVPGAAVLVCPSRYLAGRFAEARLDRTVHVLDDGFQHFDLMRDIDLLIAPDELTTPRTLPAGRFREPLDAASAADALLVEAPAAETADELRRRLRVPLAFTFSRCIAAADAQTPVFAFAGIARPERFYDDLARAGWQLTGRRSFRDHHSYSAQDIRQVEGEAAASGAQRIVTTEKDYVRLPARDGGLPIVAVPLEVTISPEFTTWLSDRLRAVRA